MVHFGNDWDEILAGEFEQDYYKRIRHFLKQEYAENTIYPPMEYIFNALRLTPYSSVKAVILGQDPYHGPGQAHGLCFSVQPGVKLPPVLLKDSIINSRISSASAGSWSAGIFLISFGFCIFSNMKSSLTFFWKSEIQTALPEIFYLPDRTDFSVRPRPLS